jgi:hypothetical protein
MMQTLDEQMRRDALMGQMGGPVQTQPVGPPVRLDEAAAPPATLAPAPAGPAARPPAGDFSRMTGYDANNWGNMNSTKYQIGEIAARHRASPTGATSFLQDPDLLKLAPNVRNISSNGKNDVFDFGGIIDPHTGAKIGRVDMGISFDPANPDAETQWGWNDLDNVEGGGMQPQAADLAALLAVGQPEQPQGTQLDEVMAQIQALSQGADDPMQREALMRLLGQEQI